MERVEKIGLNDILNVIRPLSDKNYENLLNAPNLLRILHTPVALYANKLLHFLSLNSTSLSSILDRFAKPNRDDCDKISCSQPFPFNTRPERLVFNVTEMFEYSTELGNDFMAASQIFILLLEQIIHIFYIIVCKIVGKIGTHQFDKIFPEIKVPKLTSKLTIIQALVILNGTKMVPNDVNISKPSDIFSLCHHKDALNDLKLKSEYKKSTTSVNDDENDEWRVELDLNLCQLDIKCRLVDVPPTCNIWIDSIKEINYDVVGKFVLFFAKTLRVGDVKVLECEKEYICAKCKYTFIVNALPETFNFMDIPSCCPSNNNTNGIGCNSTNFIPFKTYNRRIDYQELRVDDSYIIGSNSNISRYITIVLTQDLIGNCIPGDIVQVTGFVKTRWKQFKRGEFCQTELFIQANNVEVVRNNLSIIVNTLTNTNQYDEFWAIYSDNIIAGRNEIVKSFAPNLIGVNNAKLAILLSIIGGIDISEHKVETSSRWDKYGENDTLKSNVPKKGINNNIYDGKRTNCHILLLGDPGTGKSQLLKAALELSNKSVMVSGSNCTNAGLTCSILREGSESLLAAGALVLANGGICCIDEFSLIKQHDTMALHETMEHQTLSVAKAGATLSIPCQCTVIASSNFKTKRDVFVGIPSNHLINEGYALEVDLPISLLTRFDLVILFTLDNGDEMIDFLLSINSLNNGSSASRNSSNNVNHPFSTRWGKGYIERIREKIRPKMTFEAKKILFNYYTALRTSCNIDNGGITVRTLESLLRLSQAHARLLYRDIVQVFDAVSVIWVMEIGLRGFKIKTTAQGSKIIGRQGLFSNFELMFSPFNGTISNGIVNTEMYQHFESILLKRINIKN